MSPRLGRFLESHPAGCGTPGTIQDPDRLAGDSAPTSAARPGRLERGRLDPRPHPGPAVRTAQVFPSPGTVEAVRMDQVRERRDTEPAAALLALVREDPRVPGHEQSQAHDGETDPNRFHQR